MNEESKYRIAGDIFLLCTDGLTNNKMSKNILNSLNRYDDLTKAERRKMARLLNKMVNKLMNKPAKKCQSLIER